MNSFDPENPIVLRLLEAGRDDLPSEQSIERTMIAVATAATGIGITASAAATHAAGAGVSAVAKNVSASMGRLAFAKWTGIGLSAGLVTLGAMDGASRLVGQEPAPVVVVPPKTETRAIAPHAIAMPAPRPRAVSTAVELEEPSAPAPARSTVDPLGREVSRLDGARAALDGGRPREALAAIVRYETEYPQGRLLPEALVLRMRALEQLGDRAGARAAAERIVEISPSSPHAARARAMLEAP